MNLTLLGTAVVFELIYLLLFSLTIKRPGFRFWPPPSPRSWQFLATWLIAGIVAVNFLFLGLLDFDSAFFPGLRTRLPVAMLFFVSGSALGIWSSLFFGLRAILGLGDTLIIKGPYRYTRNPQYISDSLNIIGYIILTNSWMVGLIGILGVALNLLAPFTEEPWLTERFGDAYLEYKRQVPRFIGKGSA